MKKHRLAKRLREYWKLAPDAKLTNEEIILLFGARTHQEIRDALKRPRRLGEFNGEVIYIDKIIRSRTTLWSKP